LSVTARTVARKLSIGELFISAGRFDILNFEKSSTDLYCFIFQFGGNCKLKTFWQAAQWLPFSIKAAQTSDTVNVIFFHPVFVCCRSCYCDVD